MIKLIAFDLDKTLADLGEGILPENIQKLKQLEDKGITILLSSGKPVYYLCGFMRQVGLKSPILMGENGGALQVGIKLPPSQYYIMPYPNKIIKVLQRMKEDITQICKQDIFLQPNQVGLTVFPKNEEQFTLIRNYLNTSGENNSDLSIYEHIDSFDITPSGINKGEGLKYLCNILGIQLSETVAVGDGSNDIPMFEVAGYSIGIAIKETERADVVYSTIEEALDQLLKL